MFQIDDKEPTAFKTCSICIRFPSTHNVFGHDLCDKIFIRIIKCFRSLLVSENEKYMCIIHQAFQ